MARKNRRNAHRYVPGIDRCSLGWSVSGRFRTVSARLANLSVSGALLTIEDETSLPQPGRVMISLGPGSLERWTRAELLDVSDPPEGPRQIRLRLLEPIPYDVFKATVWGEKPAASPATAAPDESPGRVLWENEEMPIPEAPRLRWDALEPRQDTDPARRLTRAEGEVIVAPALSPECPALVETHRKIRANLDRVEPIPWLTITFFSTLAILLLLIAVTRHYGTTIRLGDVLSLLR